MATRQISKKTGRSWMVDDETGDIFWSDGTFYGNYKQSPGLSTFEPPGFSELRSKIYEYSRDTALGKVPSSTLDEIKNLSVKLSESGYGIDELTRIQKEEEQRASADAKKDILDKSDQYAKQFWGSIGFNSFAGKPLDASDQEWEIRDKERKSALEVDGLRSKELVFGYKSNTPQYDEAAGVYDSVLKLLRANFGLNRRDPYDGRWGSIEQLQQELNDQVKSAISYGVSPERIEGILHFASQNQTSLMTSPSVGQIFLQEANKFLEPIQQINSVVVPVVSTAIGAMLGGPGGALGLSGISSGAVSGAIAGGVSAAMQGKSVAEAALKGGATGALFSKGLSEAIGSSIVPSDTAKAIAEVFEVKPSDITAIIGRGALNAALAAASGGDVEDVIRAGALPLAGVGVSSAVSGAVPESLGPLEKAAERAITSGVMGELSGKSDFGETVIGSLTGSAIGAVGDKMGLPAQATQGALDLVATGKIDPVKALTAVSDLVQQAEKDQQIERAYSDPSRDLDIYRSSVDLEGADEFDAGLDGAQAEADASVDSTSPVADAGDGNLETDYVVVDRGVVVDQQGNPIMGSGTVIDDAGNPMNVVYELDEDYAVNERGEIVSSSGETSPDIGESTEVVGVPEQQDQFDQTGAPTKQLTQEVDEEPYLTATSPYEQERTGATEGDYGASALETMESLTGVPGEISPGGAGEGVVTSTGEIVDQGGNVIASPTTTTTTTPAITPTTAPRVSAAAPSVTLPAGKSASTPENYYATFLKPFIVGGEAPKGFTSALDPFLEAALDAEFMPQRETPSITRTAPVAQEPLQTYNPAEDYAGLYGFRSGGLVPLMAQGGTRHGENAHGALRVLEHSGKHRVDYRQGDAVTGIGDGQSDDIPAMLADGEFVIPADVVAALGNGSTKAGSDKLYEMMHNIRRHHRSTGPKDLPPPAKPPLEYIKRRRDR